MAGFNYLRTFIIITVTAFANLSMAQNLTLDQLIAMKSQSVAHIDEALTLKNWQMTEAEESTDTTLSHATYAYGKSSYDDKALSFLSVYFRPYDTNRILLQVNSRSAYNNYMARIKALGFRLQASRIEDGSGIWTKICGLSK